MSFKLLPDKKMKLISQANVLSRETCGVVIDSYKGHPELRRYESNKFNFRCIALDPIDWIKVFEPVTSAVLDANVNNYGFKLQGISNIFYLEIGDRGHLDWNMDLLESDRETSKLSLYIPLNDDFTGGKFEVMDPYAREIEQRVGELTMFPSFVISRHSPTGSGIKRMLAGTVTGLPFS